MSTASSLFLLLLGEAAEGGEHVEEVASASASFSEDAADFRENAASLSGRDVAWLSSVTTSLSSTSPPSGRGGRGDAVAWFYSKTEKYRHEVFEGQR